MHVEFANAMVLAMSSAQISIEKLAELCDVSRGSISNYRSGDSLPSDDVMSLLMQELNAPWLGWIWLRSNKVGATLLPDVPVRQLSEGYCDLQVEMSHVAGVQMDIAHVCRDNRVGEDERPRWQQCTKELVDLAGSIFSMLLVPVQKEKTASQKMRAAS